MLKPLTKMPKPVSLFFRFCRSKLPNPRMLCWKYAKFFGQTITIGTAQGRFTIRTDDEVIGKHFFIDGQYELDLIRKAEKLIEEVGCVVERNNGVVIDVGANIGFTSITLLLDAFAIGAVAVEPAPINYSILRENIKLNQLENSILSIQTAISSDEGKLKLELNDTNFGDNRIKLQNATPIIKALPGEKLNSAITVPSITLDRIGEIIAEKNIGVPKLLWIDVQGHEGYVFQGGKQVLSTGLPTVSEIWPYGILRSGMTLEQFCEITSNYWSEFWVLRRGRFIKYHIRLLIQFLYELGCDGEYDNVVFTRTVDEGETEDSADTEKDILGPKELLPEIVARKPLTQRTV